MTPRKTQYTRIPLVAIKGLRIVGALQPQKSYLHRMATTKQISPQSTRPASAWSGASWGLAGTSVLFSSGDSGVAGNRGKCIGPDDTLNDGKSGRFNPGFPASCPYVTAVGATQIVPGASVTQPEKACESVIFSGGGFSNVFPLPAYQSAAVTKFLTNYPPPYGADRFNNSGEVRAFPDISANGANYVIAVDGMFSLIFGTSASSPTVGSILTLINEARFAAGKGSIGFINPTLYANPGGAQ